MDSLAKRFQYLLDSKGIDGKPMTVYRFCERTNSSKATMGAILKGRKPQDKSIRIICDFFNVREEWLTTGEGEIYIPKRDIAVKNVVNEPLEQYGKHNFIDLDSGQKLMLVPFVDQPAQAGFVSGYADASFLDELPYHPIIVEKYHKGEYYAFRVVGDSMDDGTKNSIEDKTIVTGRIIDKTLWRSKFHIHRFKNYVIVHNDGVLVKEIIGHDTDKGEITIHSLNSNYQDDVLQLDDCIMILNVVDIYKKP